MQKYKSLTELQIIKNNYLIVEEMTNLIIKF